jgi:MurNAc alpha-1-phosphate uridylyltransferase
MKTALILAAGRGERLRPITDSRPKALCIVQNKPIIEYHVANLAKAGFERIVINHAYLGGQIRHYLGTGSRFGVEICYSPEPPGGLETGGGIVYALPLLGKEPFLTVNADIVTDYNFSLLTRPNNSLAHVVLVNKPTYLKHADFGLCKNNLLDNTNRQYTFPGIACYHPELFRARKLGRYSVTPILRQLAIDQRATGELYTGKWLDIGTPERLELANNSAL